MTALVTIQEIRDYLQINSDEGPTTDANLGSLANYASSVVEDYCSRTFAAANVTEIHDGGHSSVFVDRIPLNSINVVFEYDGTNYVELIGPLSDGELPNVSANANAVIAYVWDTDTGQITRDTGLGSGNQELSITFPQAFANYKKGVKVDYNGGYTTIPNDLKLATLDYIKILYKQEQGISSFTFQGESKEVPNFSANFPPHIRRILELYRIQL